MIGELGLNWSHYLRFQAQAERNYRYAVEELERLRSQRQEKAQVERAQNGPISDPQPEQNQEDSWLRETNPSAAAGHA